jgi:CSLREA domain-containing protein
MKRLDTTLKPLKSHLEVRIMLSNHRSLYCRVIILIGLIVSLALPSPASADSFVVNNPDDTNDGLCDGSHCSLREAINAANNNPGPDTISFAGLDATGGHITIQLNSFLNPLLDDQTTIDGTTALGYINEPVINLVKDSGVIESGISIQGNNCVVRGLSMAGFFGVPSSPDTQPEDLIGAAIVITGSGNLIEGNVLGWGAFPNSRGVWLSGAGNSVIGNVISGNTVGIHMTGPNQVIRGNQIGTDASGTVAIPNTYGIYDSQNSGGGHVIGGIGPADRNVISGNTKDGVYIRSNSNTLQGNYIGTNNSGTAALGNNGSAIHVCDANHNLIGGPGAGNLLSGNGGHGVILATGWEVNANNVIQGNKIGTDINGVSPIPNQRNGIYYVDGGGSMVGGLGAGEGNISAYNGYAGIDVEGPDQFILGNAIFSNGDRGVDINSNSVISQNSIYDNGSLGIVYSGGQGTPPPVLSSTNWISGSACANCVVEIFLAAPDPTGAGEGKEYLGSVTASSNGDFSIPLPSGFPFCGQVTATATNSDPRTSQFSDNVTVNCFKFGPYFLIPIWTFIIGICGALGIFIRRRRPGGMRFLVPGSFAFGAVLGGGLLLLANSLPNVIVDFTPEQPVPYSGQVPTCDSYLDPAVLSPQDGAVLEAAGDVVLMWTPTGDLPVGTLRWLVELVETGVDGAIQTTQQNSVPASAFGMTPGAGSNYEWSLLGQRLLQDGETWLPFCASEIPWTFSIAELVAEEAEEEDGQEPPPAETPMPTEEAGCTSPQITALMNLTCRKGPDKAYEEMGYLLQGETAIPEGVSMDTFWYWILNPDWQGHCFVAGNGVQAECVDGLPLIAAPPLPTATTPACLPEFDRSTCNDVGGRWSADTGTCQCP